MSMATEFSPRDTESNQSSSSELFFVNRRCCFCLPYRWRKVRTQEEEEENERRSDGSLWSRGITALKKIREWSEIVAGPKWKTFIRRFNRTKSGGRHSSKFQYDPLSYALNFDEGPLQNADSDTDNEYMSRNFSSRYVSPPATNPIAAKASMDRGKDVIGPSFV